MAFVSIPGCRPSPQAIRWLAAVWLFQALIPWSWVHAETMEMTDGPTTEAHCPSLVQPQSDHARPQNDQPNKDHSSEFASVCERACALIQTPASAEPILIVAPSISSPIDQMDKLLSSYSPKTPHPPPIV